MDGYFRFADLLLDRLVWTSIQAAALIGAVWLLCRWLPRWSPAMRCLLWWLVGLQLMLGLVLGRPLELPLLTPSVETTALSGEQAQEHGIAIHTAVTGDPLFSLHYTSSSAEELGRNLPLSQLPSAIPEFFANLVKLPVLVAAALGLVIAVVAAGRRAAAPLALLTAGIATFVLIGIAGASAIERLAAVAAVALLVVALLAILLGAGVF